MLSKMARGGIIVGLVEKVEFDGIGIGQTTSPLCNRWCCSRGKNERGDG